MKKVLLIGILLFLVSCKKQSSPCYHCTFGLGANGVQPPPQDYCGGDGGTRQFKDAQGNVLQVVCVPK